MVLDLFMYITVVAEQTENVLIPKALCYRLLVTYRHGPATGGSRQVSLGHCAGGTHLSPNSIRPSGQKHPGEQAHPVFHPYMYMQIGIGTNIRTYTKCTRVFKQ